MDLVPISFLVVVGLIILCFIGLPFLLLSKRSLESKISSVEMELAGDPENACLYLLKGELLLRAGASWSALTSLEQAFKLQIPKENIEATFWGCYGAITADRQPIRGQGSFEYQPSQSLWRRLNREAPTLTAALATELWECELKFKDRQNGPLATSDQAKRLALFNSQVGSQKP